MIPITPKPEPPDFTQKVRAPGQAFLRNNPAPTDWHNHDDWRNALHDLYEAYNGICAYSAEWIPPLSDPTVDHFVPKSARPELAYEWRNYRLAFLRLNRNKLNYQDVLDPFVLQPNWFVLDFPSLQITANEALSDLQKAQVCATIKRLKLNEQPGIKSRMRWLCDFCVRIDAWRFDYLRENAPFIAYELERQGKVDTIAAIMDFQSGCLKT